MILHIPVKKEEIPSKIYGLSSGMFIKAQRCLSENIKK